MFHRWNLNDVDVSVVISLTDVGEFKVKVFSSSVMNLILDMVEGGLRIRMDNRKVIKRRIELL